MAVLCAERWAHWICHNVPDSHADSQKACSSNCDCQWQALLRDHLARAGGMLRHTGRKLSTLQKALPGILKFDLLTSFTPLNIPELF